MATAVPPYGTSSMSHTDMDPGPPAPVAAPWQPTMTALTRAMSSWPLSSFVH